MYLHIYIYIFIIDKVGINKTEFLQLFKFHVSNRRVNDLFFDENPSQ